MDALGFGSGFSGFWKWNPSPESRRRRIRSNSTSPGSIVGGGYQFPVKQAITAASLALTGNTIAQISNRWSKAKETDENASQDVLSRLLSEHDLLRALRMTSYGFLFYGPGSFAWYQLLDHCLPKPNVQNLMLKVLLNQIVLGPCVIAVVFAWNNLWQQKLSELPEKYRRDALPALLYGFRFWVPVSVLNFCLTCTETIGKEDLEHIFRHQELGVGVIHTYIRFLYDNFMRGNDQLSNRFRFVSSSLVNKALICREPDSCREYLVKRFMASSTNNLYLWPYNSGCHWLLLAIDPLKEVVYFLNSIDGEWTNYPDMKQLVDTSIKVFRSQRQARVPRTKSSNITWIKVQCPLQRNGIDCGYFVMRFMREIINMNQIEIPITYFDEYKCAHYTRLQLEQIKEELCQYFIEKRLISI
ncbi:hypothetical protein KIW84_060655 [Lathyrus oleraceus]|uniref:Ubiquitin-like protease family profile domain-containing protein n=1 Tax=Pisum sativum TaxID=3888 RepID=A0A9D4W3B4_PEA|nr:hypothetical protein KIW84_060655 [Pisum sativum]